MSALVKTDRNSNSTFCSRCDALLRKLRGKLEAEEDTNVGSRRDSRRIWEVVRKVGVGTGIHKWLLAILAFLFALQFYFVRELIAAELLFALGFAALFILGATFYIVGVIGEKSFRLMKAGGTQMVALARRSYNQLEETTNEPLRHPTSESAQ